MKIKFDVTAQELVIVKSILQDILPSGCKAWVFGSRAKHQAKFNSDLDLALVCSKKVPSSVMLRLEEAFEESKLPYTVDLVDLTTVEPYFREIIDKQKVEFPLKSNVPKLRFPEFSGEWCLYPLSKFMNFKNGLNAPKEAYGSGYKFINVLDIINNSFITHDVIIGEVDVDEENFDKNTVEYGDMLFQRSSETREEVGQSNVYLDKEKPAVFGGFVIRGKKKADYNPVFMNYLLKTSEARKAITTKSGGSTRYNVGQETLSSVRLYFANDLEQQKIANFLTSIDTRIQQLTRKKALLEQYKKGMMQKLFSQEIRFKDDQGKDYPDWEEKRLGMLFKWVRTNSFSRDYLTMDNVSGVQNIHYGDIHTKFKSNFWQSKEQIPYLVETADRKKITIDDYCQVGDVVIADASEDYDDIGKAVEIMQVESESLVAGLHTFIARPLGKGLALGFSGYLLRSKGVRRQVMRIAQGISVLGISKKHMEQITFCLPYYEEQQKIANFLSAIDERIEIVSSELTKAQTYKKSLLQQMFV